MASDIIMRYQGRVPNLPVRFSFGTQYLSIKNARSRIKERRKIKTDFFFFCGKGTELCILFSSALLLKCSYVRVWAFAAVWF